MLAIGIAVIGLLLLLLTASLVAIINVRRQKAVFLRAIKAYFESPDADTPSQFALVTDAVGKQFAHSIVSNLKATSLGVSRGIQKQDLAVEKAVAADMLADVNPLLATAIESMPALKKLVEKKPQLAMAASAFLKTKGKGQAEDNGQEGEDFHRRLNSYG